MKKFIFFTFFCLAIFSQTFANTDTQFVVVRGPKQIAEYKQLLSSEASSIIRKQLIPLGGIAVEDCTSSIYRYYNISLSSEGPTNAQIIKYIHNLDDNIYDKKAIFVYDFYIINGTSYLTLRVFDPTGIEFLTETEEANGADFKTLKNLIRSVTFPVIKTLLHK